MTRPTWASNQHLPITVVRQRVPRRYQQHHRGRRHFISYFVWNFYSNRLLFLRVMPKKVGVFSKHSVYAYLLSFPRYNLSVQRNSPFSPSTLLPSTTPSLFRSRLKNFLFQKSFPPQCPLDYLRGLLDWTSLITLIGLFFSLFLCLRRLSSGGYYVFTTSH